VVGAALRRAADRADGREEELRADLANAEAERDRLVEAIASGGEAFQSVRDRLADTEQSVATITADLERVRFEKQAARTPTAIRPSDLRSYLRGIRHAVKRDVPAAKRMITCSTVT
jgi:chromosome segregation ATPase